MGLERGKVDSISALLALDTANNAQNNAPLLVGSTSPSTSGSSGSPGNAASAGNTNRVVVRADDVYGDGERDDGNFQLEAEEEAKRDDLVCRRALVSGPSKFVYFLFLPQFSSL